MIPKTIFCLVKTTPSVLVLEHFKDAANNLDGGKDNDKVLGGNGNDNLKGGMGNDWLSGGNGDDILVGGLGKDVLITGSGEDVVICSNAKASKTDLIKDFDVKLDLIDLHSIFKLSFYQSAELTDLETFKKFVQIEKVSNGTAIRVDSDGNGANKNFATQCVLQNVQVDSLLARNFVLN